MDAAGSLANSAGSLANVDLNLLKALDALLREQHVTRAAARLMISQPSMSAALGRLRRLLDDEILVRAGREMYPTPYAETIAAPVRDILLRIEQTMLRRPGFDPSAQSRRFTILTTDYPMLVLLRPLLTQLQPTAPGVHFRVHTARPDELMSRRRILDCDIAVIPDALAERVNLPSQVLFSDRFVAATWRGNDSLKHPLTLESFRALPYLTFQQGGKRTIVDEHLDRAGVKLDPATVVESYLVGAMMLAGTKQIAFLQERLVTHLEVPAQLHFVEPPVALPGITEMIVWPDHLTHDPGHAWLRDQLARVPPVGAR